MEAEVVIIGGGFAGTSAAITLARANRSVFLVDTGKPRNRFSEHSHGILGFDSTPPSQILDTGHCEFTSFGGKIITASAESLTADQYNPTMWNTYLSNGEQIRSRHVLVTTGITDKLPKIAGLESLWGSKVFHCPYCHGNEVKNKDLAIIGGENPTFTFRITELLTKWANTVTFFPNGMTVPEEQKNRLTHLKVKTDPRLIQKVSESTRFSTGVEIKLDGEAIDYEACFTGPTFIPNDSLLKKAGCAVKDGWVQTSSGLTSRKGLWAAGNVVSSPDQVPQAIGAGAATAIKIDQELFNEDMVQ